jgi:hypothetical protein
MRRVSPRDYKMLWDGGRCYITHKSGKGGHVGCGSSDTTEVFAKGGTICVLSVNYDQDYACLECFDDAMGASSVCFFESKDIRRHLGDLHKCELSEIAEVLYTQC